ncbi:hypothetical protein KKA39_02460 [Patescibacteria group bacterium]|nr:hypothetical protein [Patescibacteria group bacterium]MBU1728138.1 hypothetical protein [Patescibacteria group bacterium]
MNLNPEKKSFENKTVHPSLDKKLLLSEILSDPKKGLDKNIISKAEKLLGGKEKLSELIQDLIVDETIIRQEKIDSPEQNLEKIKSDIFLEIDKKVSLYIENYPLFEKCRKAFSSAKNLEEFLEIKELLIEIAKKIGQYDASDTPEAQKRNEALVKQNKTLLENPSGVFKFFFDPEYVKTKRKDLHNINGLYMPDKENPDGGDGWEDKKIGNKQISTVIDTSGHGLRQAYAKLFIEKILSLATEDGDDLFEIDNFLLEIDEASFFQFQLNAAMIRTEIEEDENGELNMNAQISGDTGFFIYRPKTREIIISGFEGEYPGVKINKDFKRMSAMGTGYKNKTSFAKSTSIKLNKDDKVYLFSDGGKGGIKDAFEQIGKINHPIDDKIIINSTKDRKIQGKQRDDITVLKIR